MFITRSALPISPKEFKTALESVCRAVHQNGSGGSGKLRLGLAVSGGVDSMALAALCSQRPVNTGRHEILHAFTVDHAARAGSAEEAQNVGHELQKLGFQHQILKIDWPHGIIPSKLSNFESQARTRRYRALGTAALDSRLDALLVAHHEDDQAETMLMRLASSSIGPGLRLMSSAVQIPECVGMYGVHQSGRPRFTSKALWRRTQPGANTELVGLEDGGIMVCRPLLGFSKQRLIATCRAHHVKWFEDETNRDKTASKRHAVRHLLEEQRLPIALRKESVLNVARVKRDKYQSLSDWAHEKLKRRIDSMDLRSGVIHVRLGSDLFSEDETSQQTPATVTSKLRALAVSILPEVVNFGVDRVPQNSSAAVESETRAKAAFVLREVVNVVTPRQALELSQMDRSINGVFGDIAKVSRGGPGRLKQPVTFNVAGVCFEPVRLIRDAEMANSSHAQWLWSISRQPLPSNTPIPKLKFPPTLGVRQPHDDANLPVPADQTKWHLFDGRYWFRIDNRMEYTVTVRPLLSKDLNKLRKMKTSQSLKYMNRALHLAAPGKVRETLPVIAREDDQVLAIPTLGIIRDDLPRSLTWEVSFKKIDLGADEESVIIRGNTHF